MLELAYEHVEKDSNCVVATVPAGLDERQMQSIREFARKLEIEILEEPKAAYYASRSVKPSPKKQNSLVLVLDLGGESSKASLL